MSISSANSVTNTQSAMAAAMQEANETIATTKTEAARGDQQAVRKLAKVQQQQESQSQDSARTPENGVGEAIDQQG